MSTTTLRAEQPTPVGVPVVDANLLRGLGYGLLFSSVLWLALALMVIAVL